MIITRMEPVSKSRSRIYLDERPACILYKGEIRRMRMEEGMILEEALWQEIKEEILLKRAKARCLHLLESMSRTEAQIRQKLRQGDYPTDIIEAAVEYVKQFQYIDDERYAKQYMSYGKKSKSFGQMKQSLMQKGVSKEAIDLAAEEEGRPDERELIQKWIEKKKIDIRTADRKELQKLYGFLMRKGFSFGDVCRALFGREDLW